MMRNIGKLLLVLLLVPFMAFADKITIKNDAPEIYIVKPGDTLWDISNMFLDRPWLWPELWRNNVQLVNPHLIYPGDELRLRYNEQGEPEVEVVRQPPKPVIHISPSGEKVAKMPAPIPTLPWDVIAPYVQNNWVMSEDDYDALPYVLGNQDGYMQYSPGDFLLSHGNVFNPGDKPVIIRRQSMLMDKNGDELGIQVRHVADAKVEPSSSANDYVTLTTSNFEVRRGDKLMSAPPQQEQALPLVSADQQRGFIIESLEQHSLLGKYNVVVLDLGESDVQPGTIMGIYEKGPNIIDKSSPSYANEGNKVTNFLFGDEMEQPAVKTGQLVVFQVFDKVSYALITESAKIIRKGAIVAHP